jgi:sulfite exporter TauE/SafE
MQGLLLGMANGTSCLALCAPVLIPFLLTEGGNMKHSGIALLKFLGGRLLGYLLFGLLAWAAGGLIAAARGFEGLLVGVTYIGFSVLLLAAVFRKVKPAADACSMKQARRWFRRWPVLIPVGMGLLAGLKICPPLLLAFTDAASSGSLGGSLFLFITFFIGTSLYFLPLLFLGEVNHLPDLRTIGRFAAVIVSVYYLVTGILLLAGGL